MVHSDSAGYIQTLHQVNATCSQTWLVLEWKFNLRNQILSPPLVATKLRWFVICSNISLMLPRTTLEAVLVDTVVVWIRIKVCPSQQCIKIYWEVQEWWSFFPPTDIERRRSKQSEAQ